MPTPVITAPIPSKTFKTTEPIAVTIAAMPFPTDSITAPTPCITFKITLPIASMAGAAILNAVANAITATVINPSPAHTIGFIAALPNTLSPETMPFIIAVNPPPNAFIPPAAFPELPAPSIICFWTPLPAPPPLPPKLMPNKSFASAAALSNLNATVVAIMTPANTPSKVMLFDMNSKKFAIPLATVINPFTTIGM